MIFAGAVKEMLIKVLTPFTGTLCFAKFFCRSKVSPLLFLNIQYNKVDFEHF